jgi:hypothetical protein
MLLPEQLPEPPRHKISMGPSQVTREPPLTVHLNFVSSMRVSCVCTSGVLAPSRVTGGSCHGLLPGAIALIIACHYGGCWGGAGHGFQSLPVYHDRTRVGGQKGGDMW